MAGERSRWRGLGHIICKGIGVFCCNLGRARAICTIEIVFGMPSSSMVTVCAHTLILREIKATENLFDSHA